MSLVIVLDPGHGGEEFHGGEFGPYIEKDIDLMVAKVIKSRLEQYDDVKVYMTRETDIPVELKTRCDIAKSCNADYFFSIHFNLSSEHDKYGAEVWVPAQNSYYKKMYPVADELMKNFDAMGLFNRGIKTKLGSGGDNYYAVIKYATNYGIPSCIIEHCHMDNIRDNWALPINSPKAYSDALYNFGTKDADAIARGLHLKSTQLGIDYTNYATASSNVKSAKVIPDNSAPEINAIELISKQGNKLTINMHAVDKNGYIQYYRYSFDNGITYSPWQDWPRTSWNKSLDDFCVTLDMPSNATSIVTMVSNGHDMTTLSNALVLSSANYSDYSCVLETKTLYKNSQIYDFGTAFGIAALVVLGIACIKKKIGMYFDKTR